MSSAPHAIHCRTRFRTQSRSADFTTRAQRFFVALKDKPGRKIVWIISAGGGDPLGKLGHLETGFYGIELSIGGNIL
jgi:branched-chain amino acid transport system substrate-binding protein